MTGKTASGANKLLTLIAVTLAFSFTFLSHYIWSPLMNDVSAEFGINATQAGLYMSAFFAGYLITQIPGGILADKYQPKYILLVCTVLGGLMTGAMALLKSYEMGLVIRVVTGISAGCVMAQCSKIVAITFAPQQRAMAMGVVLASPPFGITLAQSIGAPMNQAFGWRGTFAAVAAVALVIAVLIVVFVKPIDRKGAAPAPKGKQPGMLEGLRVFFTDSQQLILGVSGFLFMFVTVGFATWTNRYVQSLGLTAVQGGLIVTCYSIAGVVGSCVSGGLAAKLHTSHRSFLLVSLAAMAVMTLVFAFQRSYGAMIGVGIVYGAVSYLPSTHYTTLAMKRAGDRYSATAASTQNLLFQLSSLIMPVVLGYVLDSTNNNYSYNWYIFFGCCAVASVLCLLVKKNDN